MSEEENLPICMQTNQVKVGVSPGRGRGVFANFDIDQDTTIEICPALILDNKEVAGVLSDYAFNWTEGKSAIALSYGSLYNHRSKNPNADFQCDLKDDRIVFYSLKDIKAGEEIFIDYIGGGDMELSFTEK